MVFLTPTTDVAFKKLFASQEHSNVLINFLNNLLGKAEGEKIVTITINDPHNLPEAERLKYSIVDVRCQDQAGKQYIVEMQVNDHKDFIKRALYYTSIAYTRQLADSVKYNTLLPVIFVGVLDFNLFSNPHYLSHHFILDSETKERAFFDQEFHFIELKKFTKQLNELDNDADKWIYLLKNAQNLKTVPQELSQTPGVGEAFTILEQGKWTIDELDRHRTYLEACFGEEIAIENAIEHGIAEGMAKGMAKGRQEGAQEKARAIAQHLFALGALDTATIATMTGLSIDEIEKLK